MTSQTDTELRIKSLIFVRIKSYQVQSLAHLKPKILTKEIGQNQLKSSKTSEHDTKMGFDQSH